MATLTVMARPKKNAADRLDKPLRIRLTESDRAAIDSAAAIDEQETSTWAREQLLKLAQRRTEGKRGR